MSKGYYYVSKDDQKKMKDDVKSELKQMKAEMKQKEKDLKAEEKLKEKEEKMREKEREKGDKDKGSSNMGFFGLHFNKGGCGEAALTFIQRSIAWLEEPGTGRMEETGLYRLSGSHSAVQRLKQSFAADAGAALSAHEEVHAVTGVLKLYFREMPEPIIPFHMYDAFIAAAQSVDESRTATLQQLVLLLPCENRAIFTALFSHLHNVALAANSMDAKNLAIVFAPNLFRPKEDNPELVLADAPYATELVADLIQTPDKFIPELAGKNQTSPTQIQRPQPASNLSETDEQLQKYDAFIVANYISHYQTQGYDEETAKKWALYYLQQQYPQVGASQAASCAAHASQSDAASTPHDAAQPQSHYAHANYYQTPQSSAPTRPVSTPEVSYSAGGSGYNRPQPPLPNQTSSQSTSSTPPAVPSRTPSAAQTLSPSANPYASAQPPAANLFVRATIPTSPRPAERISPRVSPRNSLQFDDLGATRSTGPVPPPRPRNPPTLPTTHVSQGSDGGAATAPPVSPRPNRPMPPPPTAPNFANKLEEKVETQQRLRGQSISKLRTKVGAENDDEYKQKVMQMMAEYRSGNVGVLQDIQ